MTMGNCPHGEFELSKGCPKCIAEKAAGPQPTLVKVRYYSQTKGEAISRDYTYFSVEPLKVYDIIQVPVRGRTQKAIVTAIDVPESEIASFKDKVKTIPAGSVLGSAGKAGDNTAAKTTFRLVPESIEEEAELPPGGLAAAARAAGAEVKVVTLGDSIDIPEENERHVKEEIAEAGEGELFPMADTVMVKVDPESALSFERHLKAAKRVVEVAKARIILTEADAKSANDDLNTMATLLKAVDEERKTFTTPLNDYLGTINGSYKTITVPLEEADQITRKLLTTFKVEEKRKADEAEKINRDAIDVARRQAEAHNGEFTADTTPVPVPHAPKLTRTDQGKSGLVDKWKYEIIDRSQLPREYMMPNDTLLASIAKNDHDRNPVKGVRFYNDPGLRVSR